MPGGTLGHLCTTECTYLPTSDDDEEQARAAPDQLDLCASLAQEQKDICILACRPNFRLSAPRVAEMARQFLATHASSAGIERLFITASLTYSDLSYAMTEGTLAQKPSAMSNYSPALYIEGSLGKELPLRRDVHFVYAKMTTVGTLSWQRWYTVMGTVATILERTS